MDKPGSKNLRIALFGAGLIGRRHAEIVTQEKGFELAALIDPTDVAREFSSQHDCPWFSTTNGFFDANLQCDGVIIATPNQTHRELATACMQAELPCLVEKPLAADASDANAIAELEELTGVPVLVGHHRRHHKASLIANNLIQDGALGRPKAAQVTWMLNKPDDYFTAGKWRQEKGGGPVWINLIHEIDMLRFLLGEITQVSTMVSKDARVGDVEDTAIVNLRFDSGVLANCLISDTTPSPWHFEGASGENPNIAPTGQNSIRIFGTRAALEFPRLAVWKHGEDDGHWGKLIDSEVPGKLGPFDNNVALRRQLEHFGTVIKKETAPLVSALDGLRNIEVAEAILQSAETGSIMALANGNADQQAQVA